jgi:hypothetical protein
MTEAEWLDCRDVVQQNCFLMTKGKGSSRKLRLFLCACCRHAYDRLTDEQRRCVSRTATYLTPLPELVVGDVWQVFLHAVEVAERFADGLATESERRTAYTAVRAVDRHYGAIAAGGPFPGEDPAHENAIYMGCHAAAAADCAVSLLPAAAEQAVRLAADAVAYAGTPSSAALDMDPDHPHMLARRAERAAQWRLLVDVFGEKPRSKEINSDWLGWHDGTVPKLAQAIYENRAFHRMPELADALEEAGCDNADLLAHCRQPGEHVRGCWVVDLFLGKE